MRRCAFFLLLFLLPLWLRAQTPATIGEEVSFRTGGLTLSGSILAPSGPGPHPAVAMLEDGGDVSYRQSWDAAHFPFWKDLAEHFRSRGFVVLLYNKPGIHTSTGNWEEESFQDRAGHALDAVRYLATRADVDAGRIGVLGHGQGGWVAQLAAARAPDAVRFLVLLAGPAVSVRQHLLDERNSEWRCRGVSTVGRWLRATGASLSLQSLSLVSEVARPNYLSRIIRYDPAETLRRVSQPTLALYAENDALVYPEVNIARLRWLLGRASRNAPLAVHTIAGADHHFRTNTLCNEANPPLQWAPGFFPALDDPGFWRTVR